MARPVDVETQEITRTSTQGYTRYDNAERFQNAEELVTEHVRWMSRRSGAVITETTTHPLEGTRRRKQSLSVRPGQQHI